MSLNKIKSKTFLEITSWHKLHGISFQHLHNTKYKKSINNPSDQTNSNKINFFSAALDFKHLFQETCLCRQFLLFFCMEMLFVRQHRDNGNQLKSLVQLE